MRREHWRNSEIQPKRGFRKVFQNNNFLEVTAKCILKYNSKKSPVKNSSNYQPTCTLDKFIFLDLNKNSSRETVHLNSQRPSRLSKLLAACL